MNERDEAAALRRAAEERLKAAPAPGPGSAAEIDMPRLVHEMQVREIELELQNSELRQSRAEREAALARYTELYDFAPVGYLTLGADGLIAEINLTGATMLGVARREVLKKRLTAFVAREDQERWAQFLQSVKGHTEQENVELVLHRSDGSSFHAQLNCVRYKVGADSTASSSPLASPGDIPGVRVVMTDISVRKGVEAKLHEAVAAAEKANRAKTDFLSSMSHELRTPLNAILGFAQLMETSNPPPTPMQQRDLGRILKAGWYLLELINEILDLALIESGKAMLSREPVSLAEVMLECRAMIEPQARKRGIDMAFPQFELPCFVSADRTRVKQVLINLLFNAVKYNRPRGTVVVECCAGAADSIRVNVRDSGAGLDAGQVAQLFQPFNRLGQEAGVEEGTGIGLVVTKRLVELMDGRIGAESTVGVGSVFWIELNQASAPSLADPAAGGAAMATAPLADGVAPSTLLYVEDNPANLELVEQLVARRPNLRLISAADGRLGIEFAFAYRPDVILMDINLPGISGLDAMKILRADPSTAHIPIIALSANAIPNDIAKGLDAGFYSYLTKPIRIDEFMTALDTALKCAATTPRHVGRDQTA